MVSFHRSQQIAKSAQCSQDLGQLMGKFHSRREGRWAEHANEEEERSVIETFFTQISISAIIMWLFNCNKNTQKISSVSGFVCEMNKWVFSNRF